MRITQADASDVEELARLLWLDTRGVEPTLTAVDESGSAGPADAFSAFAAELGRWWALCRDSHAAFVARLPPEPVGDGAGGLVGMAWVALVPRVPRPGATSRLSADIQSVFVLPAHRGRGIGSALVQAACEHAADLGSLRVTVHSGRRAVPVYHRLGFESSPQLLQMVQQTSVR